MINKKNAFTKIIAIILVFGFLSSVVASTVLTLI